jgi:DNA-binding response OmpR family regulator
MTNGPSRKPEKRLGLRGKRVLVVDADEPVSSAAHDHLEKYGCIVETAQSGSEALSMVRNFGEDQAGYQCIIADVRLPDMTGYELMVKLQDVLGTVPLVMMSDFGYDPGHSIIKGRQAGLKLVLFKPFRLDQLLDTVEEAVSSHTGF